MHVAFPVQLCRPVVHSGSSVAYGWGVHRYNKLTERCEKECLQQCKLNLPDIGRRCKFTLIEWQLNCCYETVMPDYTRLKSIKKYRDAGIADQQKAEKQGMIARNSSVHNSNLTYL